MIGVSAAPALIGQRFPRKPAYYFAGSPGGSGTNAGLGNGTLRLSPWMIAEPITIDSLLCEIITTPGDVGSTLRAAIYNTGANGLPGRPLATGILPTDAIGIPEIAITPVRIPAGLLWVGGAIQGVTVTQPTIRTFSTAVEQGGGGNSAFGPAGVASGYSVGGVTDALPDPFIMSGVVGAGPRLQVHVIA